MKIIKHLTILVCQLLKRNYWKNTINFLKTLLILNKNFIKDNKRFPTELVKVKGFWHSIDNMKDLDIINTDSVRNQKFKD